MYTKERQDADVVLWWVQCTLPDSDVTTRRIKPVWPNELDERATGLPRSSAEASQGEGELSLLPVDAGRATGEPKGQLFSEYASKNDLRPA